MARRRGKTAAELMRELEADPKWVAARDAREARHRARADGIEADARSVYADLAAAGVSVGSLEELSRSQHLFPPGACAVLLLRHLDVPHLPAVREWLIRTLSVSTARAACYERLRAAYAAERDGEFRWLLANALSSMASFGEVSDLPGMERYAELFDRA